MRNRIAHACVILIQPAFFGDGQKLRLHQVQVDGRQRDGLKAHHLPLSAQIFGLRYHHQILDADAEGAGLVEARLVGTDHARHQLLHHRLLGNILRPFMHRQIRSHAMAGAVVVIEANDP